MSERTRSDNKHETNENTFTTVPNQYYTYVQIQYQKHSQTLDGVTEDEADDMVAEVCDNPDPELLLYLVLLATTGFVSSGNVTE